MPAATLANPSVTEAKFKEQLVAARTFMVMRYPFYSGLLQHMTVLMEPKTKTASISMDDKLRINPVFFDSLGSSERRAFVLAHEVLHPALGIFWRAFGRDHKRSNRAHDYVINLVLQQEDPRWVIENILLDKRFDGLAFEEVYAILTREDKERPKKSSGGQGGAGAESGSEASDEQSDSDDSGEQGAGDGDEGDGDGEEGSLYEDVDFEPVGDAGDSQDGRGISERMADRWRARVASAAQMAKMQGHFPAGLQRLVDEVCEPVIPWQDKLRLIVSEAVHKSGVDWGQPHRRYTVLDYYAPREIFYGCECVIYTDTSGSVSPENLKRAAGEAREIIRCCGGKVRWLCGDASVATDEWIDEDEVTNFKGGGGTSFVPVFDALKDGQTRLLVCFTDLDGTMPDEEPQYPVIWAVYEEASRRAEGKIPFGEMVVIPDGE